MFNKKNTMYSFFFKGLLTFLIATGLVLIPLSEQPKVEASTLGERAARLALDQVGQPYRYGGISPSTGFATGGLVYYVYSQNGVELPKTMTAQSRVGEFVSKSNLRPGDLVFFRSPTNSSVSHVGIYVGSGKFVASAPQTNGVVIRSLSTSYYSDNYLGARRVTATTKGEQIVETAEKYLGTPYRFGATGPNSFDCSGLVQRVYAENGIRLPRTAASQSTVGTLVAPSQLKAGDLIFFKDTYKPGISHVGIYDGNGQIIHAWPNRGVITTSINNSYLRAHYAGIKRIVH